MIEGSANEVEALAAKAARGAGAGVAQAAHFGRAAAVHLAAGRSGDDLLAALDDLPGGPVDLWPVLLTTAVGEVSIDAPARPDLLASYLDALPYQARVVTRGAASWTIALHRDLRRHPALPARIAIDRGLWAALSTLAHRTYVPQSDASRLAGAGAGLTDND